MKKKRVRLGSATTFDSVTGDALVEVSREADDIRVEDAEEIRYLPLPVGGCIAVRQHVFVSLHQRPVIDLTYSESEYYGESIAVGGKKKEK